MTMDTSNIKTDEMVTMGVPTKEPTKDMMEDDLKPVIPEDPKANETTSASGWTQVKALMEKNALTKVRTPGATMAELFSPMLLCLVLFISYNLSETTYFPAKYYHAIKVDIPFFWDNGAYHEDEAEDFDLADTHRRRGLTTTTVDGETLTGEDYGLEQAEEESSMMSWARLFKKEGMEGSEPEEEFSLVNDLLMMRHLRVLETRDDLDDEMMEPHDLHDDAFGVEKINAEEADSGDWMEEIMADIKKETIDKVDWEEVEEEIKDNFGELWDDAKDYIFSSSRRSARRRLDQLRVRLKDILRRPIVVPTFGQYVWASTLLSSFVNVKRNLPRILKDSSYGRQWGNLLTLGTIHLAPHDHPMTPKFIEYLHQTYPAAAKNVVIRVHDDHDAAMDYVMNTLDNERTWAVIDLSELADGSVEDSKGGSFTIRLNYTTVPNTNLIQNYVASGLSVKYQRYYLSGYLTLQRTINDFIMADSGCEPHVDPFFSMPMPTAAYDQNAFFLHVGYLLGLVLVMAFLYPTSRLIQSLVEERETRMKETLLILGVRPWAHTTSWVLTSMISFTFVTFLMSLVLKNIIQHTPFGLIWFWMALFGMAAMSFCFFLASFFSKAKLAAVIGPMALFASLLPRFVFFGTNRYEAIAGKYFASLFPGTALAFGADIIGDYEYGEQSVGDSMWVGDYSFGSSLTFLLFDAFFYMFLAWYTEQVIPREYGAAPKPWYFIFMWCLPKSLCARSDKTLAGDDDVSVDSLEKKGPLGDEDCVEPVTDPALLPRVFIKDLVKRYNKKQVKPSVNHLDLTLYESQITALLGHNGAGKTTTVSVLTGLFPPTSGDVSIYGHSVVDELHKARQSIGICPQHNVLFDRLTVMEHMRFFSKIKGVSIEQHDLKARALELGLSEDQLRTTAGALSGGNKRKLSVAIALCGNPKFLILDEPTSAMDPTARRRTWEVLRKKRAGRVTLLTTHFMDEAEHLSDRVAVVKQGELQCCGTPLYLKDKYNLGWNLTVVMEKPEDEEATDSVYAGCQDRITNFLQQYIPQTELVRRSGRELTFCFPKGTEDSFPETFDAFEQQSKDLGASSYGIENASFEEVFLLLAEKDGNTDSGSKDDELSLAETRSIQTDNASVTSGAMAQSDESVASSKITAGSGDTDDTDSMMVADPKVDSLNLKDMETYKSMSSLLQIGLLYYKRVTVQKRDFKGAFFAVILPVALVALVILVLASSVIIAGPPQEMSPALYENSYTTTRFGDASTEILVGGGASTRDQTNVHTEYLFMDSGLTHDYPNARFTRLDQGASSSDISEYLIETYNDHDRPTRFGAFSIDDNVQLNFNINFTAFQDQINYYTNKRKAHGSIKLKDQRVDILEVLGIAGQNGRLYWRKSVAELADDFYRMTDMDPHARVRTRDLHNLTHAAIQGIMASSDKDLEQMRLDYENRTRTFVDELYTNITGFMRSPEMRELQTNATKVYDEFMVDAKKIVDQSDAIERDLQIMIKDFVQASFKKQAADKGDDPTQFQVYAFQGNLEGLARNFVKDLGTLGEDPETNTLSIYGLVDKLINDVRELANNAMLELTGTNYTVSSLEAAVRDALEAVNGDEFDRHVIIDQFSTMIDGLGELYGYGEVNTKSSIKSATEWVDARLKDYSDGSIQKIPGNVLVAPVILMDYVLGKWDMTTISPDEAFGYLSELLGGNRRKKNGFLSFRAKDIVVDFGKLAIDLNNVFVTTGHGTLLEIDQEFSLQFSLDALQSLVPPGTPVLQFQFDIPSKTSLLHNSSSPHAVAVFNQAYMEHRYKQCLGDVRGNARLVSVNHPLPLTAKQNLEIKVMLSVLAGLFILIPFCYIPATFVVFLVKERISKSKHLQLVSGVNMSAYWIANYLWDLSLYFVLTMCIMIVFLCYGNSAQVFVGDKDSFLATFFMVFGYGVSSLPFSYLLSRCFSNSSTAQISIAGIGWLTGFVTVIAYYTMDSMEKTEHIAEGMQPWFRLFPAYNVGEGLMQMSASFWQREILGWKTKPLDWDVTGQSIFILFALALPYFCLVLVLEYADDGGAGGYFGRLLRAVGHYWTQLMLKYHGIHVAGANEDAAEYSLVSDTVKKDDDDDVAKERQYVMKNNEDLRGSAPVVLLNLWKVYPPSVGILGALFLRVRRFIMSTFCFCCKKTMVLDIDDGEEKTFVPKQAVRGVTTAIKKGETYALLGANGAGKTTTMGMITGDISATGGGAFIAGHNATGGSNNGVAEARKNIGFCPQKDPLLDLMTGRETLTMFAKLRGIPAKDVDSLVEELLERLTLTPHADKVTRAYSGGNKRKLSLGLALIGDPKVLLIDESSSGLDPLAKRKMWDLIEEAARSRSVILTTHSMQEAEALCTRVAIMVKGKFVCLGSVQHLKSKYLNGYSVDVFCRSSASDAAVEQVEREVLDALPGSCVQEKHGRFLRFEVQDLLSLGSLFLALQGIKNNPALHVENYAVSQCSLEQVFVKLVQESDVAEDIDDVESHYSFVTAKSKMTDL